MAQIIDGKKISTQIKDEVKEQVAALKQKGIDVTLAVIQVVKILHLLYMSATKRRPANM